MHTQDIALSLLTLETSGVPIYVQLRDQFLRCIMVGVLKPGDQMPTMRQVAVAVKVDLNTVRHAYEELERAGAVVLRRGRGTFVAQRPAGLPTDTDELDNLARQTLAAATALGLDPGALAHRIAALAAERELTS